ncbi:creatininase family protein [Paenibacillus sp. MBLB4367]|uniref:creatininase family protein n=1 Tax=Paenibacillus sp. MBLB4367 TaxID=3384767 RepID=UPI00390844F2
MNVMNVHGREIGGMADKVRFAVVPLGALEYHGPHSPLGTDIFLAGGFAERIDPALKPLLYPTIPYTFCPGKTGDYPGTVSIRPSVVVEYMSDVLEGICRLGIRNIVLLNAHDGNMGTSRTVAEFVTSRWKDASILLINWWQMAAAETTNGWGIFQGTTGRGHGGPYEMSAVKAMHPELVSVSDSDAELDSCPPLSPLPYILVEGKPQGWDGYTGRIKQTTLQAGKMIVEEAAVNMNALIRNWLQMREQQEGESNHGI